MSEYRYFTHCVTLNLFWLIIIAYWSIFLNKPENIQNFTRCSLKYHLRHCILHSIKYKYQRLDYKNIYFIWMPHFIDNMSTISNKMSTEINTSKYSYYSPDNWNVMILMSLIIILMQHDAIAHSKYFLFSTSFVIS